MNLGNLNDNNFSAGPGALPESVLLQAREAILSVPEIGLSVLGISHRSDWFANVVAQAQSDLRSLLGIDDSYHVLFLQGGSSLLFGMIPQALLHHPDERADYIRSGYWSSKSIPDAQLFGKVNVVWDGSSGGYRNLPTADDLSFDDEASYFHYVSNETVEGLQFHDIPGIDSVSRICDMSSDFLSKPIDCERYAMIYAHAQKNLGPAGVTVVVMHESLLDRCRRRDVPAMLSFHRHVEAGSVYNTPPVFAIYVLGLVLRWMLDSIGGLEQMDRVNTRKATCIYDVLDKDRDFWDLHAHPKFRSAMNIAFRLRSPQLESTFLQEAEQVGFRGLEGHRTLGGLRISLYNGVEYSSVCRLATFMEEFSNRYRNKGDAG
jgi:phosphoserine aminotransferase